MDSIWYIAKGYSKVTTGINFAVLQSFEDPLHSEYALDASSLSM